MYNDSTMAPKDSVPEIPVSIRNAPGVPSYGEDGMLLFECVRELPGKRVLGVGVGTGFVSVMLAKVGKKVTGVDVDPRAISCAKENARRNDVSADFFESDMFELIADTYDIIIANPPYRPPFPGIGFYLVKGARQKWLRRLMGGARARLDEGGVLVVVLYEKEQEEFAVPYHGASLGFVNGLHAVLFEKKHLPREGILP